MKKILSFLLINFSIILLSQVGLGTSTPNQSAILEISSPNKGIFFNYTKLQSVDSPLPFQNHQVGLWVYNSETSGVYPNNVTPGLYYNDGTKWIAMIERIPVYNIGEIKASSANAEYDGWYLLNGRSITTLPLNAQNNARFIGINSNLPNATDRLIKGTGVNFTRRETGGGPIVLTRENLPNIQFSGETSSNGNHSHTYDRYATTTWNFTSGITLSALSNNSTTATENTEDAGNHTHQVYIATGGNGTPINLVPKSLTIQYYIYLGQ